MGAEITLSPIDTCAMDIVRSGSGLAIRFPLHRELSSRQISRRRTTVKGIVEMYRGQLKKLD